MMNDGHFAGNMMKYSTQQGSIVPFFVMNIRGSLPELSITTNIPFLDLWNGFFCLFIIGLYSKEKPTCPKFIGVLNFGLSLKNFSNWMYYFEEEDRWSSRSK